MREYEYKLSTERETESSTKYCELNDLFKV